jgi:nucleotide-binding universal stress UspA family protein
MDSKGYALAATRNAARPERKLLVAFDGSPAARCALEYAIEQAHESASAIHVVNVQIALDDDAFICRSHKQAGERILKAATAQLDLHGIRYTTDVAFGAAAESIVRSAAMQRCDLIVVGTRDRLAIASFFSASVSSQVVRLAQVPVTVIKQKVVATTHSPRQVSVAAWRPSP